MGRLKAIPSRLAVAKSKVSIAQSVSYKRMAGRKLQSRRLRLWAEDPRCVDCGQITLYPNGFELDHEVALMNGGRDVDSNCRIRCIDCHKAKTKMDLKGGA